MLSTDSRGIVASVGSSLLFAGIYLLTPLLLPASAELLWALRNLWTIPVIVLALVAARQWHLVTEIWGRLRVKPVLLIGILVCGFLVGAQLWLFAWGPLEGRGLQVALGYFLLPLVLVVVGKFLYQDRLAWWQWTAAVFAGLGVGYEFVRVGGLSWETLVVALGYPTYFVLRRALGTGHIGGMLWEFVLLVPVAVIILLFNIVSGAAFRSNAHLWWSGPAVSVLAAGALILYLLASRLLTISVFGLLSYLEPALLVFAAMLNGEVIGGRELPVYLAVWAAVLVLVSGGVVRVFRHRHRFDR